MSPRVEVLDPRQDLERTRTVWGEAAAQSRLSFFQSWPWLESWLRTLPGDIPLELRVLRPPQAPPAAFFLGRRTMLRARFIPSRCLLLGATGVPALDEITPEYNSIPGGGGRGVGLAEVLAALPEPWDELLLPALDAASFPGNALDAALAGAAPVVDREAPSYYVDLDKVRAGGEGFLPLIRAKKKRYQLRKNLEYYRKAHGEPLLTPARDAAAALKMLERLARMQVADFARRGMASSFAGDYMMSFHRELIGRHFEDGCIQMLEASAGGHTLGILYNLVHEGRVLVYNFALNYEEDPQVQPGLLANLLAIDHNAGLGMRSYDFLAGEAMYKRNLSTDQNRMVWVRIRRPRLAFRLEGVLLALARRLRGAGQL